MTILAIDTSCDETSAAVCCGRKILSNVVFSQIHVHRLWGGVVPSLARRAHAERIDEVVKRALKQALIHNKLDAIAVTRGPGLAIALEVGIAKAVSLAEQLKTPLIAVNHLEGHLYSVFCQNKNGNPVSTIQFPYLALIISGKHTELVVWKNHLEYEVIGATIDDAAGEALDKAGKLLGLGYPAGSVIERLAKKQKNKDIHRFPRPMIRSKNLQFSFSGLKTAFYYYLLSLSEKEKAEQIADLASSFQEAVFDTLLKKTEKAIQLTGITKLVVCGGVAANLYFRKKVRQLIQKVDGEVLFPVFNTVTGDNAAMIGAAADIYLQQKKYISPQEIDRLPQMKLRE